MTSPQSKRLRKGMQRRGELLAAALRPPGRPAPKARPQQGGKKGDPSGGKPAAKQGDHSGKAGAYADGYDPSAITPSTVPRLVDSPVFVLCSIRSGSTLLRVLLNSHSRIRAPHEMHLRTLTVKPSRRYTADVMDALGLEVRELEHMLWDRVLHHELDGSGKAHIVDKTPANALIWPRLAGAWPNARFIHLLRHPASIVESVQNRRQDAVEEETVQEVLRYVQRIEDARHALSGLTVRYEDLTADPERETREICAYLGVDWEPEMLKYGEQDHGPIRPIFGDWSENIKSGEVKAARPLPDEAEIPAPLRETAKLWGYLD